jgi:prolyl oligopeptidase
MRRANNRLIALAVMLSLTLGAVLSTAQPLNVKQPLNVTQSQPSGVPTPPRTRTSVAADTLHGVVIEDPYRWLEDFESDEAQAWIHAQRAYMDSVLGKFPGREAIRNRLDELFKIPSLGGSWMRDGRIFFVRRDPENEQSVLYYRDGLDGVPRVLVDPEAMSGDKRVSMDWWYPSIDAHLLAYGLSEEGSEASVLHLMNVDTGVELPLTIPNMRAASLAWKRDSSGFYYTRFPSPGEVPDNELFFHRKIYYHELGTDPADDPLIFADEEDMYAWPGVSLSTNGRFLLVYVFSGYTSNDLYVKDLESDQGFVPIAEGFDARFSGFAYDDQLYLMTTLDAPNWKIVRVDLKNPAMENWTEVIPESDNAMQRYMVAGDYLVVHYLEDAKSVVRLFSLDGAYLRDVPIPELTSVFDMTCDYRYPRMLIALSSFLIPPIIYHYDIPSGELSTFMEVDAPIDESPYTAEQVWYSSKDGTSVPMFLVHRKDIELDGRNPTLLSGYGGFASSVTPSFARNSFLWLDHGGVLAEPCLRGGGEYGDAWHRAGMLANKQNTFDDFIAAAEWLINEGYTRPEKLAVWGGSNGGLLIGAFVTQRPDLARAAICDVPLLDMVRFPLFYGATLWTTEYGNPQDPEAFKWLYAYSPYHHVEKGVSYPAMLITTAESDTRVHPSHAMKMVARMQAATASEAPIFLRYERAAGHGTGTTMSMLLDQYTDYYTFLFSQLGMPF